MIKMIGELISVLFVTKKKLPIRDAMAHRTG